MVGLYTRHSSLPSCGGSLINSKYACFSIQRTAILNISPINSKSIHSRIPYQFKVCLLFNSKNCHTFTSLYSLNSISSQYQCKFKIEMTPVPNFTNNFFSSRWVITAGHCHTASHPLTKVGQLFLIVNSCYQVNLKPIHSYKGGLTLSNSQCLSS